MKKRSMQEPTFLILTALAAGPQHGYGIITDAERISGGVTRLQTGTLYMALDRRYLRLLRYYPPTHREEMLGVLLAAARPGQRAPGPGQAVNLAACGLV